MRDYMLRRGCSGYITISQMQTQAIEKILSGQASVSLSGRQGFTLIQLMDRLKIEMIVRSSQ